MSRDPIVSDQPPRPAEVSGVASDGNPFDPAPMINPAAVVSDLPDAAAMRGRLDAARERVADAAERAGRRPDEVTILLATKTVPAARVRLAAEAGYGVVGENRVQELVAKAPELAGLVSQFHLIGPLQANKINAALRWATCIQTVADGALAARLSARVAGRPTPLEVMVQVNTSGEATKSGCRPPDAAELAAAVAALPGLRLRGFMTIGPLTNDAAAIGRSYALLRTIRDDVVASGAPGLASAVELSMGMSGDLAIAVAEGATMVRLGSAIFGPRLA